jgi:hypothetical protein
VVTRLDDLADQLVAERGLAAAVDVCLALLDGADRAPYLHELRLLSGHPLVDGADAWADHWVRSWGARGLLRAWEDRAAPHVVRGLADPH